MYESLADYKQRTDFMWNSLPHNGDLCTNSSLQRKVTSDGFFRDFFGDTVIFSLDSHTIKWLEEIQNELYKLCGECLSEKIKHETFHITLHDLRSSTNAMPENISEYSKTISEIIKNKKSVLPNAITVKSTCLFSMVGTSIVMGFEPENELSCSSLMQLYDAFQAVTPLSYPLTLHATVAYYKPGNYNEDIICKLRDVFEKSGRHTVNCKLDLNLLNYATFDSMNSYQILK